MTEITIAIPFSQETASQFSLAVRSVIGQSCEDFRLLLIGDDPRQELADLARMISDDRVRVHVERTRQGLGARLNQSVAMVDTNFYVRMDADDIMFPNRISEQFALLRNDRHIDVVGSRAVVIDESNTPEGLLRERADIPTRHSEYLRANVFTHPSIAGRTEWFLKNRYNERIKRAEDKELWLRTATSSIFVKTANPLLFYRVTTAFHRQKSFRTAIDDGFVSSHATAYGLPLRAVIGPSAVSFAKSLLYAGLPAPVWAPLRAKRIDFAPDGQKLEWLSILRSISRVPVAGWDKGKPMGFPANG